MFESRRISPGRRIQPGRRLLLATAAVAGTLLATGCSEPAARSARLTAARGETAPATVWFGAGDAAGRGLARGTLAQIVADSD